MTDRAALAADLESLWRQAQIDYPLKWKSGGAWLRAYDNWGNYLLTLRSNNNDAAFLEALLSRFPEILAALKEPA